MKRLRTIPFVVLLALQIPCIVLWFHLHPPTEPDWINQQGFYKMLITDVPQDNGKYINTVARMQAIVKEDSIIRLSGKIRLTFQADSLSRQLQQGDIIIAQLTPAHANKHNPHEFDYDTYLKRNGIDATAFINKKFTIVKHQKINTPIAIAQRIQRKLVNIFINKDIQGENLAILSALTLGDKEFLDADIRRAYSAAGAMHILAVSGLHVGIIYTAIFFILTGFGLFPQMYRQKKRKIANTLIIIICLWIYAFITGLSPSVLRSTLMLTILAIGLTLDEDTNTWNIIAASAFIILLFDPLSLFSVSFQLSYCAVAGIILFTPPLQKIFILKSSRFFSRLWNGIWSLVIVSIAAQAGVFPLSLYYFHLISNYFVLTNIVVIPAAYIIIFTAIPVLTLSSLTISLPIAKLLNSELTALNFLVRSIENLQFSTSEFSITLPMLFSLFTFILLLAIYIRYHKLYLTCLLPLPLILFISLHFARMKQINSEQQLIIYNSSKSNTLLLQHGNTCTIYTDSIPVATQLTEPYIKYKMLKITDKIELPEKSTTRITYSDANYLLYSFNRKTDYDKLTDYYKCDTIILMSSLSKWRQTEIISALQTNQTPYIVMRNGAHIIRNKKANGL